MERPSNRLDRRVLFLWWTIGGVLSLAVVLALTVIGAATRLPTSLAMAAAVIAISVAGGVPPLRFRRWRYEIRERDILLSRGALFFVLTLIPFDRIQYVETRQGPLDRLFGLNQVLVFTAAGRAGRVPGLDPRQSEAIREELSRVAGARTI